MKKILFCLVWAISLVSCLNKTPDYAIISGQIDHFANATLSLTKADQSFGKEIAVGSDGTFADTIEGGPGLYRLAADNNRTDIYLAAGSAIRLTADTEDFTNTLQATGEGAETTRYIFAKHKKTAALKGEGREVYKLEEPDFIATFQQINTMLNAMLDTTRGIPPAFTAAEKRNLKYNYWLELSRYSSGYHKYASKNPDYEPSKAILSELADLDTLDLNNEEDFLFSAACKQLIINHYVDEIRALSKKDSIDYVYAKLLVHSTIPNETIRNELIFSGAEFGMIKTENFEDYYQVFMNASTNPANNAKVTATYNKLLSIRPGQPSPKFTDYENNAGGRVSLDDFKGKYIYIDVWATWCGPCLAQLPFLQALEKQYEGRNIHFLSISIDTLKNYNKWKKMIADNNMGGIQVIADNSAESQFVKDYFISSIPRFILIDPEGIIVTKNAPRPSSSELIELFNSLNI